MITIILHNHHLRVLGVAFARVVPSRQLLVEEAAEDVSALGYSGRGFVQEVSGREDEGGDTFRAGSPFRCALKAFPL